MKRTLVSILLACLLLGITVVVSTASPVYQVSPPGLMTYQGHLLDSSGVRVPDGQYQMTFAFYDAPVGGTLLWGPEEHYVDVDDGYFSVVMGSTSPIGPANLSATTYLEITVSSTTMAPRHRLTSVAFALVAGGVISGSVSWDDLADIPPGFADGVDNSGDGAWLLDGNSGTDPDVNFVGTTDDEDLYLAANSTVGLRLEYVPPDPGEVGATINFIAGVSQTVASYNSGITIGGGVENNGTSTGATVSGGFSNTSNQFATVGGGKFNRANGYYTAIGGGYENDATGSWATVSGGRQNAAINTCATIAGGISNQATGEYSIVGGGSENEARESYVTIAGGYQNVATSTYATIAGGYRNVVTNTYATIAGGYRNASGGDRATVGGGMFNTASGDYSFVGGGRYNDALGNSSVVGGGNLNIASGYHSGALSGSGNTASAENSVVCGGSANTASGTRSTVPGGIYNLAAGGYSFAAGRRAKANHDGAFVWGDSTDADIASSGDDQFIVRASGGISMYTNSGASTGAVLAPGSGSWSSMSDRNLKENVEPVDGQALLDALSEIEIGTWNYISQEDDVRHLGPMAQDFYTAFGLGENDTTISVVDADGVALAAIQALYERVLELEAQVAECQCGGE